MRARRYVNLHHHSTFSFGDGFGTPARHVERAAELGFEAIALTEHGNVSSHFQLEKAAKKAGIKPIYGLEAYCGPVAEGAKSQWKHHLTILAMNLEGYQNLNRIVTQSWLDFYYHPTVSGATLLQNHNGLTVLSGCAGSLLACTMLGGKGTSEHIDRPDLDAAMLVAERFDKLFPSRYYLEVQPFPELPRTCAMNRNYEKIADELDIPLVVTCDVHYPEQSDSEMQAVLHAVHRGKATVDDQMRDWNYDVPLTLPQKDENLVARLIQTGMTKEAADEAVDSSLYIARECNVELPRAERLRYPIVEDDLKSWT